MSVFSTEPTTLRCPCFTDAGRLCLCTVEHWTNLALLSLCFTVTQKRRLTALKLHSKSHRLRRKPQGYFPQGSTWALKGACFASSSSSLHLFPRQASRNPVFSESGGMWSSETTVSQKWHTLVGASWCKGSCRSLLEWKSGWPAVPHLYQFRFAMNKTT